ncbi:MAG: hypothetical protein RL173_2124 [Fibrobacterota bacterium]|jgi:uncharacterized protein (TIGR02147 family)
MELPSPYDYNDFRRYLTDWHCARQAADPEFSKSEVSRQLGLPRTRSYFTDILAGKRISGTFLDRFILVLSLDKDEARYFRVLVRFNQAQTPEDRELSFDQLVALNKTPRHGLELQHYLYYRHWWNGAIRALLEISDYQGDEPGVIAKDLTPPITPGEAKASLELLLELGLIAKNAKGFLKPTTRNLATPESSRNELVRQLQIQQLELAQCSLLMPPSPDRRTFSNTISVSDSSWEMILQRIERFREELRSIVHRDPDTPNRVAQFTLSFIPLTRKATP